MKVHRLIALLIRAMLCEARVPSFNLHSAAGFLLNMLHVSASVTYNLCSQIEPRYRLEINRDAFLGPFTLRKNQPWFSLSERFLPGQTRHVQPGQALVA